MHILPVFAFEQIGEYEEEGQVQQYIGTDALVLQFDRVGRVGQEGHEIFYLLVELLFIQRAGLGHDGQLIACLVSQRRTGQRIILLLAVFNDLNLLASYHLATLQADQNVGHADVREDFVVHAFKTPEHIAPVWYFTPFYAILRAIPDKLMGVIAMGAAIAVLFVLPWLDRSPVKSMRYKGWLSKIWLWVFCISFVILGVLGVLAPTPERTLLSQVCTFLYFAYFILMPFYTRLEKTKPVPERVTG